MTVNQRVLGSSPRGGAKRDQSHSQSEWLFSLEKFGREVYPELDSGTQEGEQSETQSHSQSEWLFSLEKFGREVYPELDLGTQEGLPAKRQVGRGAT